MNIQNEMGAVFAETMKIGGAVAKAQQEAGLDKAGMQAIQVKLQGEQPLSDAEKAQVRAFGAALGPALQAIDGELTDVGKGMAAQLNEQFSVLLKQVG